MLVFELFCSIPSTAADAGRDADVNVDVDVDFDIPSEMLNEGTV